MSVYTALNKTMYFLVFTVKREELTKDVSKAFERGSDLSYFLNFYCYNVRVMSAKNSMFWYKVFSELRIKVSFTAFKNKKLPETDGQASIDPRVLVSSF